MASDFVGDETCFLDWFKNNYIISNQSSTLVKPNKWSVHNLIMMDMPYTQNNAEAFHRKINRFINKKRPDLPSLIEVLQNDCKGVSREIEEMVHQKKM